MFLYDFKCKSCGHIEEMLVRLDVRQADCPECKKEMSRVISPVRSKLDPISGDFPDATRKWEKMHEKEGRKPSESHPDGWK